LLSRAQKYLAPGRRVPSYAMDLPSFEISQFYFELQNFSVPLTSAVPCFGYELMMKISEKYCSHQPFKKDFDNNRTQQDFTVCCKLRISCI